MFGFRRQDVLLITLLVVVAVMTAFDVISDYDEGSSQWHLLLEAGIVILSVALVVYLLRHSIQRRHELEQVKQQLQQTHLDLTASRQQLQAAGKEYQQVIQQQFEAWQLTPSEKEIAALLLKGLSFEEMAMVRNTKEKTVRQQATAIYRKAGLNGRHEFAAWFFEDFLS